MILLPGGLNAVIWTDTIQTAIMIVGSIFLGAISKSYVQIVCHHM